MKEYFYEITKESPRYDEWFTFLEDEKKMKADVKAFAEEHGISAESYIIYKDKFWVDPTLNESLAAQFSKEREQGFAPFKKTSVIGKAFTKSGIKRVDKPFVPFFFKGASGRSSTREFDFEGKVYCQYACEHENVETPEGFVPMKASEFYAIIERATEEQK